MNRQVPSITLTRGGGWDTAYLVRKADKREGTAF